MVHRSIVYVKPTGSIEVHHQEGEVVEVRDNSSQTGFAHFVRVSGDWLYRFAGDWRPNRWESLLRAAEECERIADLAMDKASELRAESRDAAEDNAAPGVRGSAQAPGSPQPVDGTSPAVVDAALDLPAGGDR